MHGRVIYLNLARGFGHVRADGDAGLDVFFHASAVIGLSTLFEGKSPLRAIIFVGSVFGITLKRRSSQNTRRRTMLLRQDWLEDLSTRAKTQPNGGEFWSETRRSTLEGFEGSWNWAAAQPS